jgi:N-acetylglucosaminyldiphosphoundecaprenol N-acetyl-beta-D-mannosaminyltransferase
VPPVTPRLKIGHLAIDRLTFNEALHAIGRLVDAKQGGYICTPNVDHVVLAETDLAFRDAYARADLVVVDGMPIVWGSKLLDVPLPERISGSDLILPLMKMAAERGWRVYMLGGGPGTAEEAGRKIQQQYPVNIVGYDSPMVSTAKGAEQNEPILRKVREAKADLLFVALGSPKQETWIGQVAEQLRPTVAIGVGAGFDFIAGRAKRAPQWVARAGFEWLYRLAHEPKRLWRRYLVNDPKFAAVLLREVRERRAGK